MLNEAKFFIAEFEEMVSNLNDNEIFKFRKKVSKLKNSQF